MSDGNYIKFCVDQILLWVADFLVLKVGVPKRDVTAYKKFLQLQNGFLHRYTSGTISRCQSALEEL